MAKINTKSTKKFSSLQTKSSETPALKKKITVGLDAMGGDKGVSHVVDGISQFLSRTGNKCNFILFGDQKLINDQLDLFPKIKDYCRIVHTDQAIDMSVAPVRALRGYPNSSIHLMVKSVESKEADYCVSSGNTGALMAVSLYFLRTLPSIDRPAICTSLPSAYDQAIYVLDLGANIECSQQNLVEFAVMGSLYATLDRDISKPKVKLLNIGTEANKGKEIVKLTSNTLSNLPNLIKYCGYIEPNEILSSKDCDVVVTDGYSGNIALKSIEGTSKFIIDKFAEAVKSNLSNKIKYYIAKSIFNIVKSSVDAKKYNGACFLGLNGIVVKSHGNSNGYSFSYAIEHGYNVARKNFTQKLDKLLDDLSEELSDINNSKI